MIGKVFFFGHFVCLLVLEGIGRARTTILLCDMPGFIFVRIHFGQITSNQMLVPVIEKLKETTISKVSQVRVSIFAETEQGGENSSVYVTYK